MTSPLQLALELLAERLDRADASQRVERVAVHGRLDLEVALDGARRWFRLADGALVELEPAQDSRLPVAPRARRAPLLAWRPGRRMVLDSAPGAEGILKGYRPRKASDAARHHRLAAAATREGGFRLARLLEERADEHALLFERVEATPISIAREHSETHYRVGLALARLQGAPASVELKRFLHSDELELLRTLASRTQAAVGALPAGWRELFSTLEANEPRNGTDANDGTNGTNGTGELVLCHRDLHDGQLALDADGRVVLFDLDTLCRAHPALDPANLLAHYALRQLQGIRGADATGVSEVAEALIEGYQPEQPGFWSALRFYQATSLLRLSLVYLVRPRWSALAEELVGLAERCFEQEGTSLEG